MFLKDHKTNKAQRRLGVHGTGTEAKRGPSGGRGSEVAGREGPQTMSPYPSLRCEAEKVKWAHKDYGKARLTEQKSVAGRLTQPSILSAQCFGTVSFSTIINKAQGSL